MKFSIFVILLLLMAPFVTSVYGFEVYDASTVVTSVNTGYSFESSTEGIIRLADIETPCRDIDNSTGIYSAKSVLESIIDGKTVYLDKDSLYVTDSFGSGNNTVCVVYVNHNSTHFLNVNQAMVNTKYAIIKDVDNDFNPNKWTLFIQKQNIESIPEFPTGLIPPMLLTATLTVIILKKKQTTKRSSFLKNYEK